MNLLEKFNQLISIVNMENSLFYNLEQPTNLKNLDKKIIKFNFSEFILHDNISFRILGKQLLLWNFSSDDELLNIPESYLLLLGLNCNNGIHIFNSNENYKVVIIDNSQLQEQHFLTEITESQKRILSYQFNQKIFEYPEKEYLKILKQGRKSLSLNDYYSFLSYENKMDFKEFLPKVSLGLFASSVVISLFQFYSLENKKEQYQQLQNSFQTIKKETSKIKKEIILNNEQSNLWKTLEKNNQYTILTNTKSIFELLNSFDGVVVNKFLINGDVFNLNLIDQKNHEVELLKKLNSIKHFSDIKVINKYTNRRTKESGFILEGRINYVK